MAWLGDLVLRLKAETADFQQDMGKAAHMAERSFRQIQSAAAGLGIGLSAIGLGVMIKQTIDAADKLNDLSKATTIAVEDLAGLGVMAKQSGGDVESIATSINKLMQNMGKDPEKFRALGLTAKEPMQVFMQFAEVFRSIEDPQLRAAFGAEALSKSWAGAAPVLMEGATRIREMVEEGKKLSGITPEFVQQSDAFNDNLVKLSTSANAATIAFVGPFMEALIKIGDEMVRQAARGERFAALVKGLAQVAGILDTDVQRANRDAADATEKWLLIEQKLAAQEASLGKEHPVTARTRELVKTLREAASVAAQNAALMRGEDILNPGGLPAAPPKPGSDAKIRAFLEAQARKSASEKAASDAARLRNEMRKGDEDSLRAWYDAQRNAEYEYGQWRLSESKARDALLAKNAEDNANSIYIAWQNARDLEAEAAQIGLNQRIQNQGEEARRTADMARALGMTFSSAFEDAVIKGKSLQDVLRGIADDLLRIALRQSVTEPIATGFSGLLKGLDFTKIFTGKSAPYTGMYQGSPIPEFAEGTDSVPRTGLAWLHKGEQVVPAGKGGGITIQQTLSFGSDVNRATMIQWAAMIKEQTIAAVVDGNRRARYSFS